MKKLKLMGAQALTREQQRSINGGSGSNGTCRAYWPDGNAGAYYSASYSADSLQINGNRWDFTGMSAGDAETVALAKPGGRWCCTSCATASWL